MKLKRSIFLSLAVISVLFSTDNYIVSGTVTDISSGMILDSAIVKLFTADSVLKDSAITEEGTYYLNMEVVSTAPPDIPAEFTLGAYPNPVNPSLKIAFTISKPGKYTIESFDLRGRRLANYSRYFDAGNYETGYGGANTASGMQLVRISGEGYRKTVKVTFLDGGNGLGFGIISQANPGSLEKSTEAKQVILTAMKSNYVSYDTLLTIEPGQTVHNIELKIEDKPITFNGNIDNIIMNEDSFVVIDLERVGFSDPDNDAWSVEILGIGDNADFSYNLNNKNLKIYGKPDYYGLLENLIIKVSDEETTAESNPFNININPVNDIPRILASVPDQIAADGMPLIIPMNGFYVEDVDDEHIYFNVNTPDDPPIEITYDSYTHTDTLKIIPQDDYLGSISDFQLYAFDKHAQSINDLVPLNHFNITVKNEKPRIIAAVPNQQTYVGSSLLIPMKGVYVADEDDIHTFFRLGLPGDPLIDGITEDSYLHTDTIDIKAIEHFEGTLEDLQIYAYDEHASADSDYIPINTFDVQVFPRQMTNLHIEFKAVYGDTILTSGTSTFLYRKMAATLPAWTEDSIRVTENGVLDIRVPINTPLNLNGLHSNAKERYNNGDIYVFFQREGETIEQRALDDSLAVVSFCEHHDTLTVYKIMEGFPLGDFINFASKRDDINVGIRKFASYPIKAYWVTEIRENTRLYPYYIIHEPPDSTRLAWHQDIEDDIRTVPHMEDFKFDIQLVPNYADMTYPCLYLGISSDFPSPGTNATSYDPETKEVTFGSARYPWQPTEYIEKIEIHQALFDFEDIHGTDPNILDRINDIIMLNDMGRWVYSVIGIARPGTKF